MGCGYVGEKIREFDYSDSLFLFDLSFYPNSKHIVI